MARVVLPRSPPVALARPLTTVIRAARAPTSRLAALALPTPSTALLVMIALAGCAAAALTVVLAWDDTDLADAGLRAVLADGVTLPYILAGLVAWRRRPASRFGPLMIAAGFANFFGVLQWSSWPLLHTAGQVVDFLPPVLFLHVFLAFPSGTLERRVERWVVGVGYAAGIGLELARMLIGDVEPPNLLQVTSAPAVADVLLGVQLLTLSSCAVVGVGLLEVKRRSNRPALRRSVRLLVHAFSSGLLMLAALFAGLFVGVPGLEPIRWATFVIIGLAPVAFLIGLLDARLARSTVGDLFVELRRNPAPADLRDALARALRDPSLTLAYWLPELGAYRDLDGRPVPLDDAPGRATTHISTGGVPVAAMRHDAGLSDEPELLEAAAAAAAIALDNARLHAELRARLEELRGSRVRILEAGQRERQRLERDLHDGAQQRLIALSLELSLLGDRLGADADAQARLDAARAEIAASLEELRGVARGLHPAVVTGHGLAVALESLVARAAVPVRLSVDLDERLPESVEIAAYYLICEGLANIGKHAGASSGSVDVCRSGSRVTVTISDDGVGGAASGRGSGLRGLADRIEALGGRLQVDSPPGGGTRLEAEIPCAS